MATESAASDPERTNSSSTTEVLVQEVGRKLRFLCRSASGPEINFCVIDASQPSGHTIKPWLQDNDRRLGRPQGSVRVDAVAPAAVGVESGP